MTMNPFVSQILGAVVRAAVLWLAAKFGATLSDDQVVQIVTQVVAILGVLGWSVWRIYKGRVRLLTALTMPEGVTEDDVKRHVAAGLPTPAVSTPSNQTPRI